MRSISIQENGVVRGRDNSETEYSVNVEGGNRFVYDYVISPIDGSLLQITLWDLQILRPLSES